MAKLDDYPFEIRPLAEDEGGGYLISYPDFSECISDGETIKEAVANGRDALSGTIAALKSKGLPVPLPGTTGFPGNADQPVFLDTETGSAARVFVERVKHRYDLIGALVFGSRSRGVYRPDSDADVAVLLRGVPGQRLDTALAMADIAFDVLLETGVLVEPVPFWEEEWRHPESFDNPALIENIRREGIPI